MNFQPRRRIVTLRVSSDEYEALRTFCSESEVRSISEFARSAVVDRVAVLSAPRGLLTADLATLSRQLSELDKLLGNLRARIHQVLGTVDSGMGAQNNRTDDALKPNA
jgi:hypothetical protein